MSRVVLKRGNDQIVSLIGLKDTTNDVFMNDATVTATLWDSKGKVVPAFQNIPMTYVAASDGTYEWFIEAATMMLPKSVEYELEIKAVQATLDYRTVSPVSVVDV